MQKTVYAPDTAAAYLDTLNALAQANPVIAYGMLCAALMLAAYFLRNVI